MSSTTILELKPVKSTLDRHRNIAGALLFVGVAQYIVALILSEALYPRYSISDNFISDLGVGPAALLHNSSVALLGLMVILVAYFVHRTFRKPLVTLIFALAGAGASGVGFFPETFGVLHTLASFVAFSFGGLSSIVAYKLEKPPLTYFSIAMGAISLVALVLFIAGYNLGLGPGGMERMIVFPIVLWAIGFGGCLMGSQKE